MTKTETRRLNLVYIIDKKFKGNCAEFGRSVDKDASYINRLLWPASKKGSKNLGEELADYFCDKLELPKNWFDSPNFESEIDSTKKYTEKNIITGYADDFARINVVNLRLRAGIIGYSVDFIDDELPPIFISRSELLSDGLSHDQLIASRIIGMSMEPSLFDGDIVVINTKAADPIDGVVFAVNYEGEHVIKRMKRDAGAWIISSDNHDKIRYPDKSCSSDMCLLIGKIVYKFSKHI